MFRFKLIMMIGMKSLYCFNTSYVSVQDCICNGKTFISSCVSIHPMFRFKEKNRKFSDMAFNSFNTSYVSVQAGDVTYHIVLEKFQYILCFGSRSEDFKTACKIVAFQYILCFGSRNLNSFIYP